MTMPMFLNITEGKVGLTTLACHTLSCRVVILQSTSRPVDQSHYRPISTLGRIDNSCCRHSI